MLIAVKEADYLYRLCDDTKYIGTINSLNEEINILCHCKISDVPNLTKILDVLSVFPNIDEYEDVIFPF